MVELFDGVIITQANRVGNPADKLPDRPKAMEGDKLISFVPQRKLYLHRSILTLSAD